MVTHGFILLISLAVSPSMDTGTLKIQAQPGTEVIWDGVPLDRIDASGTFTISEIPAGRFQVLLRKPGFEVVKRSINISAGETAILSVELLPIARAPNSAPPGVRTKQQPAREPPAAVKKPRIEEQPQTAAKAPRRKGPLPLWPSSAAASPQEETGPLVWPWILAPFAVVAAWLLFRRGRSGGPEHRRPTVMSHPDAFETAAPGDKAVPFLSELKKREELLEQGIEIIPARRGARVIDLDSANVREVDDKPQSSS